MRIVMLVDMDYFYVACEELRRPEIKEKPTVVGFDPKEGKGRGVVMTCNYLARKFGIRSGMPISAAYRLKPDAVYLPLDYDFYDRKSAEVMLILKRFAQRFEQVSVDEAFMEPGAKADGYEEALAYAAKVKEAVSRESGLPCSIGISTNKLMAKMACEDAKPNGIKLVKEEDAKAFLGELPLDELYGIGRKTREKLEAIGYKTVGQLAKANPMELMDKLGSFGIELHKYANGIDESKVEENFQVKSIGREKTFERDTDRREEVLDAIRQLSAEVNAEVKKAGLSFKVVTIKMRYSDFTEHLKSRSIRASNKAEEIVHTAADLYIRYADPGKKLRKVGVRVSNFTKYKGQSVMADFGR